MSTTEFNALPFPEQRREARAAVQRLVEGIGSENPDREALCLAAAMVTIKVDEAEKAEAETEALRRKCGLV